MVTEHYGVAKTLSWLRVTRVTVKLANLPSNWRS